MSDAATTWTDGLPALGPDDHLPQVPEGLLPDGCRLGRLLGMGSQTQVFALECAQGGPPLAIKLLRRPDQTAEARFRREGLLLGRVRHPNLVWLVDIRHVSDISALVMHRVDGLSLLDWLADVGPGEAERLRVFRQLVSAVGALHAQGVIHRDLKPANILVRQGQDGLGIACLIDLGIAKSAHFGGITRRGIALGTPGYLAPEQIHDAAAVDHRADLFALGCLLHLLMAGRPPFTGPTAAAIMGAVTLGHREPIRHAAPDAPQWIAELVDQLLAPTAAGRPSSVAAVERILAAHGVCGPPQGESGLDADRPRDGVESVADGGDPQVDDVT